MTWWPYSHFSDFSLLWLPRQSLTRRYFCSANHFLQDSLIEGVKTLVLPLGVLCSVWGSFLSSVSFLIHLRIPIISMLLILWYTSSVLILPLRLKHFFQSSMDFSSMKMADHPVQTPGGVYPEVLAPAPSSSLTSCLLFLPHSVLRDGTFLRIFSRFSILLAYNCLLIVSYGSLYFCGIVCIFFFFISKSWALSFFLLMSLAIKFINYIFSKNRILSSLIFSVVF